MKKLILILALLAVAVIAQQNLTGTISQPVNGSFTLNVNAFTCLLQDRLLLFGNSTSPPGVNAIGDDECVRSDFFEVNGILTNCDSGTGTCGHSGFDDCCDLQDTVWNELTGYPPFTEKEQALLETIGTDLSDSTDCLIAVYNGSMFQGNPDTGIRVGADTYFNKVKPCYVRTLSALGSLEQMYIDEQNASFLVQKLQELEVDYQHFLAVEDAKAIQAFKVKNATLNGTVTGTTTDSNVGELFFKDAALFSKTAGADYWSQKWVECYQANGEQELCFEAQKIHLGDNYVDKTCKVLPGAYTFPGSVDVDGDGYVTVADLNSATANCLPIGPAPMPQDDLMQCNCFAMVQNRIMEIDHCFDLDLCPWPGYPEQPTDALNTNTCKQCLNGGLYPTQAPAAAPQAISLSASATGNTYNLLVQNNNGDNLLQNVLDVVVACTDPSGGGLCAPYTNPGVLSVSGGQTGQIQGFTIPNGEAAILTVIVPGGVPVQTITITSNNLVTTEFLGGFLFGIDSNVLLGTPPLDNAVYITAGAAAGTPFSVTAPILGTATAAGDPGIIAGYQPSDDSTSFVLGPVGTMSSDSEILIITFAAAGTLLSNTFPDGISVDTTTVLNFGSADALITTATGYNNQEDTITLKTTTGVPMKSVAAIYVSTDVGPNNNFILASGTGPFAGYATQLALSATIGAGAAPPLQNPIVITVTDPVDGKTLPGFSISGIIPKLAADGGGVFPSPGFSSLCTISTKTAFVLAGGVGPAAVDAFTINCEPGLTSGTPLPLGFVSTRPNNILSVGISNNYKANGGTYGDPSLVDQILITSTTPIAGFIEEPTYVQCADMVTSGSNDFAWELPPIKGELTQIFMPGGVLQADFATKVLPAQPVSICGFVTVVGPAGSVTGGNTPAPSVSSPQMPGFTFISNTVAGLDIGLGFVGVPLPGLVTTDDIFSLKWPAVPPPAPTDADIVAAVFGTTRNVIDTADGNIIAFSGGNTWSEPASITGSFLEIPEGTGNVVVGLAALLVVGLFTFLVFRKKV